MCHVRTMALNAPWIPRPIQITRGHRGPLYVPLERSLQLSVSWLACLTLWNFEYERQFCTCETVQYTAKRSGKMEKAHAERLWWVLSIKERFEDAAAQWLYFWNIDCTWTRHRNQSVSVSETACKYEWSSGMAWTVDWCRHRWCLLCLRDAWAFYILHMCHDELHRIYRRFTWDKNDLVYED